MMQGQEQAEKSSPMPVYERSNVECKYCRAVIPNPHPKQEYCTPIDGQKTHKDLYHKEAKRRGDKMMQSKPMHFSKVENSEPLRVIAWFVEDGKPHTNWEIMKHLLEQEVYLTYGISTALSELRFNGFKISPAKYRGRTRDNRKIYEYMLEGGRENYLRIVGL